MNFIKLTLVILTISLTACATNQQTSHKAMNDYKHPPIKKELLKNRSVYTIEIVREVDDNQILFLKDKKGDEYSALSTIGYNAKQKFKVGDKISLIPLQTTKIGEGKDSKFMLVSADIQLVD